MKSINIEELKNAIISASNNLTNHKERIDALNVFPVPDGDTGSNMSSTISNACKNISKTKYSSISSLMKNVARDMLLGARGNSGVILSQIFKGLSLSLAKTNEKLTTKEIVDALGSATKVAYSSVLKPIEGTILTVIRETFEQTRDNYKETMSIVDLFKLICKNARKSVKNTTNILPVLKEVGVVDSGGEGLLMIFEGMLSYFDKGELVEVDFSKTQQLSFISDTEIYTGEFGYCTELIIKLSNYKKFSKKEFVGVMTKLGNSLVVVQDTDILKIHIHATKPGKILNIGQKYGEFLTVKVENMTEQANNTKSQAIENDTKSSNSSKQSKPKKSIGIISCNTGNGFVELMKEYECDYIVEGGQSFNPSAQDILNAINNVNSKNVIILPNNPNIILAAQQAAKLSKNKNIHIVPTKTQVEGVTSILNYSSELSLEDNIDEINSSLKNLVVGQITKSIKDTKLDGIKIQKNHYLQIKDNKIIATAPKLNKAACNLIDEMVKAKKNSQVMVIYYGNTLIEIDIIEIEKYITSKYKIDVEIVRGDQDIYDILIGLE